MDGSPTDNGIVYCPRCGREMEDDKEARVTKAMSKKVKRELYEVNNGGQLSEGIMYKCPSCDNQDTIWDITGDGMNYCGECGQRLDWEGWSDEI
jgi:DNA-directed RNA polymerase subunit RPC12/RpoP